MGTDWDLGFPIRMDGARVWHTVLVATYQQKR